MTTGERHPEAVDADAVGHEQRPLPPPSTLEAVITELTGAVPEVRDALLAAADSLLDAARALIDAADRVLHQPGAEPPTDRPGDHATGDHRPGEPSS